ncbi:LysR family transcriptional regulator [Cloacibacillus sp. An23]|uniref:LysR family transcriptional regulator n=1 Tax=Cloacibacillus sp. An23 TaxID=1965591 RepID=UPI000B371E24|nr:LysR family transcriptional regulator [Cloacibacillus sp. An23]OUO94403.1 hypothetical protein B5F39_04035 [Cloacibacillus sp. An23]
MPITIRDIEIFLEVARCCNMTAASKNLYITQPTVSQVIVGIEKEYDVKLFERRNKKIYLTEQGRTVAAEAEKVMRAYRGLENVFRFAREETIRIGTNLITSSSIFNDIWSNYHKICYNVKTTIVIEEDFWLKNKLADGELDFVLSQNRYTHSDIRSEVIAEDEYVLICRPGCALGGRRSVSMSDLKSETVIMRETGNPTRDLFDQINAERGLGLTISCEYKNIDIIKEEVIKGKGVAVIASRLVARELEQGLLHVCEIDDLKEKRYFYVNYHKDLKMKPHLKTFIEVCKAAS